MFRSNLFYIFFWAGHAFFRNRVIPLNTRGGLKLWKGH